MKKNYFIYSVPLLITIGAILFLFNYFFNINKEVVGGILAKEVLEEIDYKLTEKQIEEGFWSMIIDENGNESVEFFSIKKLVDSGLTNEKIKNIIKRIQGSKIISKFSITDIKSEDFPEDLRNFNLVKNSSLSDDFNNIKKNLEKNVDISYSEQKQLAYMYELEGNYKKRDSILSKVCTENEDICKKNNILIKGRVLDTKGNPVSGASVEIISEKDSKEVKTSLKGEYEINFDTQTFKKIRLKASKRNYSNGVVDINILNNKQYVYSMKDLIIGIPLNVFTIDTINNEVTGKNNSFDGKYFLINTERSNYKIPFDSIKTKDKENFDGLVDVYVYEFTREDVPEGLIAVDTFDQVIGYAGDLMKTFGMPYIQFFNQKTEEELYIFSDNSMVLTNQIYHMDLLYEDYDKLYGKLTEKDMIFLVESTQKKGGYPIDRDFLIKNRLLQFPAFWVFDQSRGIWDNIGIKVLDKGGLIESQFYTIKDL